MQGGSRTSPLHAVICRLTCKYAAHAEPTSAHDDGSPYTSQGLAHCTHRLGRLGIHLQQLLRQALLAAQRGQMDKGQAPIQPSHAMHSPLSSKLASQAGRSGSPAWKTRESANKCEVWIGTWPFPANLAGLPRAHAAAPDSDTCQAVQESVSSKPASSAHMGQCPWTRIGSA